MNRLKLSIGLALLMGIHCAQAAVKGRVRAALEADGEVWVGQQATLNLELLTTGYRFSDIQFNLPDVAGAFLLQTDSTTIKLSETIAGETWQIIRYPLALYPQKPGTIQVPPIKVRFNTAESFNSTVRDYDLQTQTLSVQSRLPPGVETGELVVSTGEFSMQYQWIPAADSDEPLAASPGDAISLSVSRQAQGISGMLLNPLPVFETAGLSAYPETPQVEDKVDRGSLTGERVDKVTWIVEKAGTYEWPAIRIQWWDPVSEQLKQKQVPGLKLEVNAMPRSGEPGAQGGGRDWGFSRTLILPGILALLLAAGLVWFMRNAIQVRIQTWVQAWRDRHENSEVSDFRAVVNACKSGRAAQAYQAISRWQFRVAPQCKTLHSFACLSERTELQEEFTRLQQALLNQDMTSWNGHLLLRHLKPLRKQITNRTGQHRPLHLPALNPKG